MKNKVIGFGMVCAISLVFGGGTFVPPASKVAKIKAPCHNDTVYVDHETKLMWQDALYTDAEDGAYARGTSFGKAGSLNHAVNYCRTLDYAGYNDWRLPTVDELMKVHHDVGQHFNHSRDKDFWSSTPTVDHRYYVVYPADAYRYKRSPKESNYIRCVRCNASDE